MKEGNTVGSKGFFKTAQDFYILGLWLADGYWRSSSIGLTSVNLQLIKRFAAFLKRAAPKHCIKKRVYGLDNKSKRKQIAIQIYVNSRALTRLFISYKTADKIDVPNKFLSAYLAGRIDGDGYIDTKHRSGIRIAYSSKQDALRDLYLLGGNKYISFYHYKASRTFVLYLKKHYREKIKEETKKFSVKLAP